MAQTATIYNLNIDLADIGRTFSTMIVEHRIP